MNIQKDNLKKFTPYKYQIFLLKRLDTVSLYILCQQMRKVLITLGNKQIKESYFPFGSQKTYPLNNFFPFWFKFLYSELWNFSASSY